MYSGGSAEVTQVTAWNPPAVREERLTGEWLQVVAYK